MPLYRPKYERQYKHVLRACVKQGRYKAPRCKVLAARVVSKQRRQDGSTLRGLGVALGRYFR
jgi:hypothetical protein